MKMGPMMVRWLLDALDAADRPEAMVDLMTDAEDDRWANQLAKGGTFTWETWHARSHEPADERHNRSESHAFGATVLTSVPETLLGVRVAEAGAAMLKISPPGEGLDAASGRVPTERGPVEVDWERDSDSITVDVTVPWNATATAEIPIPRDGDLTADNDGATLTLDRGPLAVTGTPGYRPDGVGAIEQHAERVSADLGAGSYEFEIR